MKQTRLLMGMPITLEISDASANASLFDSIYGYFQYVDEKFSTYKEYSEISLINRGDLSVGEASEDMKKIFELAEQTRIQSNGFFNIQHNGVYDPSGLVKGWAVYNAAEILRQKGFNNFYIEAGGDIQVYGKNAEGHNWRVGIRNPFRTEEIVKALSLSQCGIATSGSYLRGQHIYNPQESDQPITDIVSLTVIGPNVYEADRFATAAFAMGRAGIHFIEALGGFEGYMIAQDKQATYTTGLDKYLPYNEVH